MVVGIKIRELSMSSLHFPLSNFEEEVYVDQPHGFIVKGEEENALKLNKALYGVKQAPRV